MAIGVGIHYRNEYITKEHEVNMIEKEIVHKVDHWEVSYPWTSYPKDLTNHRIAAYAHAEKYSTSLVTEPRPARIYNK